MSDVLRAALDYASRGWKVFPCRAADLVGAHSGKIIAKAKSPLVQNERDEAGEPIRDSGWPTKASADADQIRAWWTRWPEALIGLPTGTNIGAFVLDFDPRHDPATGEVYDLPRLKAAVEALLGAALPQSWTSITQSGGVHLFFALPEGMPPPGNRKGALPAHVDVRGEKGYIIAPPSVMADGAAYRWLHAPGSLPLAPAPARLLAILDEKAAGSGKAGPKRSQAAGKSRGAAGPDIDIDERVAQRVAAYAATSLAAGAAKVASAGSGTRNATLNEQALWLGRLLAAGLLGWDEVEAALVAAATANGLVQDDGLPSVLATLESGLKTGIHRPDKPFDRAALEERIRSQLAEQDARPPPRRAAGPPPPEDPPAGASQRADTSARPRAPRWAPMDKPWEGRDSWGAWTDVGPGGENWGYGGGPLNDDGRQVHDLAMAAFACTDVGNLYRFLHRMGHDFRFCREKGWLAWDGRRWKIDGEGSAALDRAILRTIELIKREADEVADSRRDEEEKILPSGLVVCGHDYVVDVKNGRRIWWSDSLRKWHKSSQSAGKIAALPKLIASHVAVAVADIDAQPWMVSLRNGTLDLISHQQMKLPEAERPPMVALRPHARADLITMLADADYDPQATCPGYDAFLAQMQPDEAMRRFLHLWAGYNLTGDSSAQSFVWHYGEGSNGKGTWIRCLEIIFADMHKAIQVETLLAQQFSRAASGPSEDIAELMGVRSVSAGEPEAGAQISEGLVKRLTGSDTISARHNFGKFFRYRPCFKIQVHSNPLPKVMTHDNAMRRRFVLVHWGVIIPASEAKPPEHFEQMFAREASGILNRFLAGLADFMVHGLKRPAAVQAAVDQFFDDKDVVGRFLAACVERVDTSPYEGQPFSKWPKVQATAMFDLFVAWCRVNGESGKWSHKGFSPQVAAKGIKAQQISVMFWLGVRLKYAPSDFIDEVSGKPKSLSDDPSVTGSSSASAGDFDF